MRVSYTLKPNRKLAGAIVFIMLFTVLLSAVFPETGKYTLSYVDSKESGIFGTPENEFSRLSGNLRNRLKNIFFAGGLISCFFNPNVINASGAANAALSEAAAAIVVSNASGNMNDTVGITISLQNNPGITSMRLFVHYDDSILQLVEVTDAGNLGTKAHSDNLSAVPYTLLWMNPLSEVNYNSNGVVATLRYKIIGELTTTPITVTYNPTDILDSNMNQVPFQVTNGSVSDADLTQLSVPANPVWSNTVPGRAAWTAVPYAAGYSVQLFKNGTALGSPVNTAGTTFDFSSQISETAAYTFKVKALGDGTAYSDSSWSPVSPSYNYTASAVQLSIPAGLSWSGTVPGRAAWTAVPYAAGYSVQLFKNGAALGSPVSAAGTTFDFSSQISAAAAYTFKVKALGDGTAYSDSSWSQASSPYNYTDSAVRLTAPAGISWSGTVPGRAVWTAVPYAAGYGIQLYKSSVALGSPIITSGTSFDFAPLISAAAAYTFKVKALGDGTAYSDSSWSQTSPVYNYTLQNNTNPEPEPEWINPFDDVDIKSRYYEAVRHVNRNGLFIGISSTEFGGDLNMTRGMFVTVLGRMAGINQYKYTDAEFSDVTPGSYYSRYVNWAAMNQLVLGYGDNRFGPDDNVTIEQAYTILFRYAVFIGKDTSASADEVSGYADREDISAWAADAVNFAVKHNMTDAVGTRLNPLSHASRYSVTYMIWKFSGIH